MEVLAKSIATCKMIGEMVEGVPMEEAYKSIYFVCYADTGDCYKLKYARDEGSKMKLVSKYENRKIILRTFGDITYEELMQCRIHL